MTYERTKYIGNGTFSEVYLGINNGTKTQVVLKYIDIGIHKSRTYIFHNEIKILKHIQEQGGNNNLIKYIDSDEASDNRKGLIVMEYIANVKSLDSFFYMTWSPEQVLTIMKGIANAISFMHNKLRVCHMDIKYENIIVDSSISVVKLIDYGCSSYIGSRRKRCGTPLYMSIEVLSMNNIETLCVDPSMDIYSLGVLFYKLLSKRLPFFNSKMTQAEFIIYVTDPNSKPKELGDVLYPIIDKMLSKNPMNRPSIDEINDFIY